MKTIAILLCLLLVACMTPQQQADALAALDDMLRSGAITRSQYEALREGVVGSGLSTWITQALGFIVTGVATYSAVQRARGPVATPAERVARKAAPK